MLRNRIARQCAKRSSGIRLVSRTERPYDSCWRACADLSGGVIGRSRSFVGWLLILGGLAQGISLIDVRNVPIFGSKFCRPSYLWSRGCSSCAIRRQAASERGVWWLYKSQESFSRIALIADLLVQPLCCNSLGLGGSPKPGGLGVGSSNLPAPTN